MVLERGNLSVDNGRWGWYDGIIMINVGDTVIVNDLGEGVVRRIAIKGDPDKPEMIYEVEIVRGPGKKWFGQNVYWRLPKYVYLVYQLKKVEPL